MKSKITARTEAKKYEGKNGVIYYRNYTLDNGTVVNLGSSDENPSWGQLGQELEVIENGTDNNGNVKYKRVTEQKSFGGGGGTKFDSAGMMIGNAVTNAVQLVIHGKVEMKDLELVTDRICQISTTLKAKYTN